MKGKLLQMHNIGIVVESLDNAISFFAEIGLKLEGRAMVEGEWAGPSYFRKRLTKEFCSKNYLKIKIMRILQTIKAVHNQAQASPRVNDEVHRILRAADTLM